MNQSERQLAAPEDIRYKSTEIQYFLLNVKFTVTERL